MYGKASVADGVEFYSKRHCPFKRGAKCNAEKSFGFLGVFKPSRAGSLSLVLENDFNRRFALDVDIRLEQISVGVAAVLPVRNIGAYEAAFAFVAAITVAEDIKVTAV